MLTDSFSMVEPLITVKYLCEFCDMCIVYSIILAAFWRYLSCGVAYIHISDEGIGIGEHELSDEEKLEKYGF